MQAPVVKKCYTSPQKKCSPVTMKECKQVPKTVSKNVCVQVKVSLIFKNVFVLSVI